MVLFAVALTVTVVVRRGGSSVGPTPPPRPLGAADAGGPAFPAARPIAAVRGLAGWSTAPDGRRLAILDAAQVTADGVAAGPGTAGPGTAGPGAAGTGTSVGAGGAGGGSWVRLAVDPAARGQRIDGFGAALTESSARLLWGLPPDQRAAVLRSLFDPVAGAGLSVVRVPMGASDFATGQYTYDDVAAGTADPRLARFSVARDDRAVVPVLREILAVDSRVRIVASPWSAPAWMKSSSRLGGGSLRPRWYGAWAEYFVRFVRAYAARGITVSAVTVQNEPGHGDPSYPTMTMSAAEQARFVATALGPAFAAAGLATDIVGYDHNWDTPAVPTQVLGDAAAGRYLSGIGWHCYRGDPSAQSQVHADFPGKATWLTECSAGDWHGRPADGFGWLADVVVDALRNWASTALLWNLALDPAGGPHLGGCGGCRGVVTIAPRAETDLRAVDRSPEFDLLGLAARAAPRGAVRIGARASSGAVGAVAFSLPDGHRSVLAHNRTDDEAVLTVDDGGGAFTVRLAPHALAAFRWRR
ncbi:glycoside hydrolase family 30 beta sandwich domain-containing protein [Frankia sp. AvcI1]|uniref:glycoside hydrolase family 30 beta sandwich domain-containing protein n=2 Tax=Frankia sp. AvcI1 TaxID=573496 RepID=UPI0021187EDF|nr:glycoside hydrolase family 30 beta sandwich domain-containing protein [Frankia sp. AvcI1]